MFSSTSLSFISLHKHLLLCIWYAASSLIILLIRDDDSSFGLKGGWWLNFFEQGLWLHLFPPVSWLQLDLCYQIRLMPMNSIPMHKHRVLWSLLTVALVHPDHLSLAKPESPIADIVDDISTHLDRASQSRSKSPKTGSKTPKSRSNTPPALDF